MTGDRPRARPCSSCPYRHDAPSGLWDRSEYEKLPGYDGEIFDQVSAGAFGLFYCHQRDGNLCAGWVGCHDMANTLAIRVSARDLDIDAVLAYRSPVPLFSSGAEACAHGLRDLGNPSPEVIRKALLITRIREAREAGQ